MARVKKPSPKQQIAALTAEVATLKTSVETLSTSGNTLIQREQDICHAIGRKPGEHPLDCARRVALERSQLADKVLTKVAEINALRSQKDASDRKNEAEITRLNTSLKSTQAILRGAADAINVALPPVGVEAPAPLTTGRAENGVAGGRPDMLDALMYGARSLNPFLRGY